MVKEADWKMSTNLLNIFFTIIVLFLLSCNEREIEFKQINQISTMAYEDPKNILWANEQGMLKVLINNSPLPDTYDIYLLLQVISRKDTLFYLLKNTDKGNFSIRGDSLIIFNRNLGYHFERPGWYEYQGESIRMIDSIDSTLDSANLVKYERQIKEDGFGIYKITDNKLSKVAANAKERQHFKSSKTKMGIYYISEPGLGAERFYCLDAMVDSIRKKRPKYLTPQHL